jgi:hypothetical protein
MKRTKIIAIAILLTACSKNNQRLTNDSIEGTWSELKNGIIKYDGSPNTNSKHYHIKNDGTFKSYYPVNYDSRHNNPVNCYYTIKSDKIYFFWPTMADTLDYGTLEILDENNLKLIGTPDPGDPSYIPTVYWRRTDD